MSRWPAKNETDVCSARGTSLGSGSLMNDDVSTRPILATDAAFLLSVFASARSLELDALESRGADVDAFVRMQFAAQARYYEASYPGAQHSVVLVNGRPVGRAIIQRSGREIVIVDIALLAASRNVGVGSAVVQDLLDEADAGGLPVRCRVLQVNDAARRFWARHGFVPKGVDGAHVAMVRPCQPTKAL